MTTLVATRLTALVACRVVVVEVLCRGVCVESIAVAMACLLAVVSSPSSEALDVAAVVGSLLEAPLVRVAISPAALVGRAVEVALAEMRAVPAAKLVLSALVAARLVLLEPAARTPLAMPVDRPMPPVMFAAILVAPAEIVLAALLVLDSDIILSTARLELAPAVATGGCAAAAAASRASIRPLPALPFARAHMCPAFSCMASTGVHHTRHRRLCSSKSIPLQYFLAEQIALHWLDDSAVNVKKSFTLLEAAGCGAPQAKPRCPPSSN